MGPFPVRVHACETGTSCVETELGPECAEVPSPCEGLELCMAEGAWCEGGFVAVNCMLDADGCVVRQEEDCEALGWSCQLGEEEESASCVQLCEDDPSCGLEGGFCEGDRLRRCTYDDLGCLQAVEYDCPALAEGATCSPDTGFCVTPEPVVCGDEGICLDELSTACEDAVFVSCEADAFGCLSPTNPIRALCILLVEALETGTVLGTFAPLCAGKLSW